MMKDFLILLFLCFSTIHGNNYALENSSLRIAAFGGANSLGEGIHLRNRFEAFPYLLSPHVDNYASLSEGGAANYNSVCLESVIGHETVYDVILLDFDAHEDVRKLAQRLRRRFPVATIVFLHYWKPSDVQRSLSRFDTTGLLSWMHQRGLTDWTSSEFTTALRQDEGNWIHTSFDQSVLMEQYATEVNGMIVHLLPTSVKEGMHDYGHYFARPTLLSPEGHRAMALKIQWTMAAAAVASKLPSTAEVLLGDFGGGDLCQIWLHNGQVPLAFQLGTVREWHQSKALFALEFKEKGMLTIRNPFPGKRRIYMSFLVSSAGQMYPQTLIHQTLRGGISTQVTPNYVVASTHESFVKTIPLGYVDPGNHTLIIFPDMDTGERPFSIVGITVANEFTSPGLYDFVSL